MPGPSLVLTQAGGLVPLNTHIKETFLNSASQLSPKLLNSSCHASLVQSLSLVNNFTIVMSYRADSIVTTRYHDSKQPRPATDPLFFVCVYVGLLGWFNILFTVSPAANPNGIVTQSSRRPATPLFNVERQNPNAPPTLIPTLWVKSRDQCRWRV